MKRITDYKQYILDRSIPEPMSGCWLWTECTSKKGYGVLHAKGKYKAAHRLSYEIHFGPIADGLLVCHKCDVRCCVNPSHLFLGTDKDNARDRDIKKRHWVRPTRGEKNNFAKMSAEQIKAIRAEYALGQSSQYKLAVKHKISQSCISKITSRKSWAHL